MAKFSPAEVIALKFILKLSPSDHIQGSNIPVPSVPGSVMNAAFRCSWKLMMERKNFEGSLDWF